MIQMSRLTSVKDQVGGCHVRLAVLVVGVDVENLVLELVDETLEVVLLVLGILDELVLHSHLVLLLVGSLLGSLVERCSSG